MKWTGERVVPWDAETPARVMYHHVMRYAWAMQFVSGKRVVDLGCGTGYGSFMLSWVADYVLGIDKAQVTIDYAEEWFRSRTPNLLFQQGDITERVPDADLYVAFEVLEHLENPRVLLAELRDPLVWSMPIDSESKYHPHVYSAGDITAMMTGVCAYQTYEGTISSEIPALAENGYLLGYMGGD